MSRRSTKQPPKQADAASNAKQRLQRLLASAGFGSRRQCEELIESGRVHVDGELVTKLGTTVDPGACKIKVDGVLLKKQKLVYYAVYKPVGVVTTNSDPHGRPRVVDLVPKNERVFAVGRLDRSSEGLILLTNDGDLAQRLTHPKFGVRKVYRVTVAGKVVSETMKKMRQGIYISEGRVSVEGAKILKTRGKATELEIILREGKNREIRRILARLGHKVQQLRRIAVGPLRLGDMPPGAYRIVSKEEVRKLQAATQVPRTDSDKPHVGKGNAKRGGPKRSGTESSGRDASQAARGTKKRVANKSVAQKRRPAKKSTAAKSRPTSSLRQGELAGSQRIGAVIGADPVAKDETSQRKKGKPSQKRTTKRTTKRGAKRKPATTSGSAKRTSSKGPRSSGKSAGTGKATAGKRSVKKRVVRKRKK